MEREDFAAGRLSEPLRGSNGSDSVNRSLEARDKEPEGDLPAAHSHDLGVAGSAEQAQSIATSPEDERRRLRGGLFCPPHTEQTVPRLRGAERHLDAGCPDAARVLELRIEGLDLQNLQSIDALCSVDHWHTNVAAVTRRAKLFPTSR